MASRKLLHEGYLTKSALNRCSNWNKRLFDDNVHAKLRALLWRKFSGHIVNHSESLLHFALARYFRLWDMRTGPPVLEYFTKPEDAQPKGPPGIFSNFMFFVFV